MLKSVYPRWRGEHYLTNFQPDQSSGLSPLARGTLVLADDQQRRIRFIPAGAGNTRDQQKFV